MLLFLTMLDSDEDQSKFVQLYHKYRYFLWYLARERLQDDHLAEVVVITSKVREGDFKTAVQELSNKSSVKRISKTIRVYGK